jgi:hypothetical protein
VRWGAVTDGRYFRLYDAPVLGVQPEERQVLSVDLADYKDRDDFEARIYPELELIAKTELESGRRLRAAGRARSGARAAYGVEFEDGEVAAQGARRDETHQADSNRAIGARLRTTRLGTR